ncbi:MAG: 3-dehydroquinate synthase [Treponema sp.]|nr:3-dehydroquinate synthase [Candidatus Treponema caballi]
MQHESMKIPYSAVHPGTEATEIFFYNDCKDVFETLKKGREVLAYDGSFLRTEEIRRVYVTDTNVAALPQVHQFLESIPDSSVSIVLDAGEEAKTFENVLKIVTKAIDAGMTRTSVFTGIGGGVITDMTAMAASLFKRGAGLELVPTTLLAMVDASIGGKTGCDFQNYKNMIGTFYPASRIFMATEFLQFLPEKEYKSGLAEVVKMAMLYAPKLFMILSEQKDAVDRRDPETLMDMVLRSSRSKAAVVERDLMESGERKQLNLGHTFGHALETCAGLGVVTHGDAVAWGCARAMELSCRLGLTEDDSWKNDVFALLERYGWCTEPQHPALSALKLSREETAARLLAAMKNDKKNKDKNICCILQREMNSTVIQDVKDEDILAVLA